MTESKPPGLDAPEPFKDGEFVPKQKAQPIKFNDEEHVKRRESMRKLRAKRRYIRDKGPQLVRERLRYKKLKVAYKPHGPQAQFGKLLDDGRRIVLFYGGIRSGKTYAGARELLKCIYKRKHIPKGLSWIISPTYPMSQVVEKEFEDACDLGGGKSLIIRKYVGNHEYVLMPPVPGAKPYRVAIKTAEHPDRLRGASLDYIWLDEAAFMDREAYRICLGRILDSKGTMFITTTPKGMNWLYEEVYQKAQDHFMFENGVTFKVKNDAVSLDERIGTIHCKTSDNPHLDPLDIEHLRGQYSVQFAKQELGAEFVAFDGLVYANFDFKRHVVEPITNLPEGAEFVCGIDAGLKDPMVCLFMMKYKDRYYVVDEYYANMRTMETHSKQIKSHFLNGHVLRRWMDPSAAQESFDLNALGVMSYPAKNDIRAGINSVGRMIELDRLFITRNCVNTLREIGQYAYKERTDRNVGEEPQDINNHCMDALRYVIYSEEGYKQNHPFAITHDNGTMELIGLQQKFDSAKLEDWIALQGYNPIAEIPVED